MRVSRFAPIVLAALSLAGCATSIDDPVDKESSIFAPGDDQKINLAGEIALQQIADRPELFLAVGDVTSPRVLIDESGQAHARVSQNVGGIPVFEGEAIIHIGRDGKFNAVTDKLVHDVNVNLTPTLAQHEAVDLAIAKAGGTRDRLSLGPKADLQILRREGVDHLTYRVQLDLTMVEGEPSMPVIFVDAHTGKIVWSYDNLETAKNRKTYTAKKKSSLPGTLLRSEGQAAVSDAVANQAHDNAGYTYDYYLARHGRDSYNGAGATITSTVHYSNNYVNAFWNGTQMVYGDGDGVQSGPLTVLDVVGHELTHAVTSTSSNLTYANESGALNEAMSDIFGASIEAYRDGAVSSNTWKIGEACWTPATAGDALRYMNDPATAGDYDYYPTRYTGASDNGGVHWNSGIANLAFKLAVTGGTHPRGKTSNNVPALNANAVTSIQMASAIFYRANTQCLTPGSTFTDARGCTEQAATALYGAGAFTSISEAWKAVGVPAPLTWTAIDTKTNLSAGTNVQVNYSYAKPAGATAMRFTTSGGSGDADIYVKFGSPATGLNYDCRSEGTTTAESCTISTGQSGTYYIMINAYAAYSGMTLTVSSGQ